jgi:hypothetical protein
MAAVACAFFADTTFGRLLAGAPFLYFSKQSFSLDFLRHNPERRVVVSGEELHRLSLFYH